MKGFWVLTGIVALSLVSVILSTGCVAKSEYEALQAQYATLQTEYATLQTEYNTVSEELSDLKKIYPPRDFASVTELEEWVSKHIQPPTVDLDGSFRAALKVQEAGIQDGYLISVMFDEDDTNLNSYLLSGWIFNATLVNGYLVYWNPVLGKVNIVSGLVK